MWFIDWPSIELEFGSETKIYFRGDVKNADIHMRDPFVLLSASEKQYYLYGMIGSEAWKGPTTGVDWYIGIDLQNKKFG